MTINQRKQKITALLNGGSQHVRCIGTGYQFQFSVADRNYRVVFDLFGRIDSVANNGSYFSRDAKFGWPITDRITEFIDNALNHIWGISN